MFSISHPLCRALLGATLAWASFLPYPAAAAVAAELPVERLGVPGPLDFDEEKFVLAWSSHPSPGLYKQEYLPAGEKPEHYNSMFVLDVRLTGAEPAQMATGMIELLKQRKQAGDPLVSHELQISPDGRQLVLDFFLSTVDADGQMILEWNIHRYVPNAHGQGSTLIGISRRGYGDEQIRALLDGLKRTRQRQLDALAAMELDVVVDSAGR